MKLTTNKDLNVLFTLMAIGIFIAFATFTISGEDGLLRLMQLKNIQQELHSDNRMLLQENLNYRLQLKSLKKLQNIEYHAHESLGLAAPGETVFVIQN